MVSLPHLKNLQFRTLLSNPFSSCQTQTIGPCVSAERGLRRDAPRARKSLRFNVPKIGVGSQEGMLSHSGSKVMLQILAAVDLQTL